MGAEFIICCIWESIRYKAAIRRSSITEMTNIESMDRAESMIERP